jgi:ribosome recycling factor
MSLIDDVLSDLSGSIKKAQDALRRDLAKLRTGRANLSVLDGVRVDYYGTPTPLNQLASLSTPEPRLILIKVWDKGAVKAIDSAIRAAGLGFNPSSEGELIRIPIPPLTEDRRKDLVRVARKAGEDAKVAIRAARRDANEMLDALVRDGEAPEDDVARAEKKVQERIDEGVKGVEDIVGAKEKDILEV